MTFTCWCMSSTSPSPDAVGPATPGVGPAWPGLSICTSSDHRRSHVADKTGSWQWLRPPLKPLPCPQTAGVWEGGAPQGHRSRSHSFRSNHEGSPSLLPPGLGADTCAWRGPERGRVPGALSLPPPLSGRLRAGPRVASGEQDWIGFFSGCQAPDWGSLGREASGFYFVCCFASICLVL